MPIKLLRRLNQSGDTIVEVMIVLAVLGLAMSISYATINRSLLQAREAQENTDASALLQSQLERLRTVYVATDFTNPALPNPFCVSDSNAVVPVSNPSCSPRPNYNLHLNIYYCKTGMATPPPACTNHLNDDTFFLSATWDNVQGEGTDEVSTSYRLHK